MSDIAHPIAAAIAAGALVLKATQLWRDPRNPALRAACGVLAGLVIGMLAGWDPLYHAFNAAIGVPNIARYVQHAGALVAAAAVQSLYLHLGDPEKAPRRARWRWAILAAVLIVMAIAFERASLDVERADDFAENYATAPHFSTYMLVYLAYLALAMIDIFRMSVRYGRRLPPSLLRLGIRLLAVGSVVGLLYVVHKGLFVGLTRAGVELPWAEQPVSRVLIVAGIILVASGLITPSIGTALTNLRHWWPRYRLYRRLQPLWEAIYRVNKEISLHPLPALPTPGQVNTALYRRVIEIRDGLRDLGPYLDPAIADAARHTAMAQGIEEQQACIIADAATIASMIDYVSTTPPESRTPIESPHNVADAAGEDPESEAEWLATVSDAIARSPIVRAHRTRAGADAIGESG
ncbi:MAB_1171c family putative transporter [Polymorphospora sp. NPDC050346]|uniref:MAB_1171c family putative transporter n=1 Tax=Polymorphospora sp. NPDC050346 TaxID=3155780 RepID=UPI0033F94F6F